MIAGLPVGLGGVLGFLTSLTGLATSSFAVGAGLTAFFLILFSHLLPVRTRSVYVTVAFGLLFMYLAGLLHQFGTAP